MPTSFMPGPSAHLRWRSGRQVGQVPTLPGQGSSGWLPSLTSISSWNPGKRGIKGPTAGRTDLQKGGPWAKRGPVGVLD